MAVIRNITLSIKTGQTETLPLRGDGLRLVSASVPIYFREENGGLDFYLEQGEQAIFDDKVFKSLQVWHLNGADQTIIVTVSEGARFNGAKISGAVTITSGTVNLGNPTQSTGSNTNATVTNASAQLVAANASRKYLLIQNKDASGNIYINFGAAATVANGLKIQAGGSFELNCNLLTAAINAIGDIASNSNIVIVTG